MATGKQRKPTKSFFLRMVTSGLATFLKSQKKRENQTITDSSADPKTLSCEAA